MNVNYSISKNLDNNNIIIKQNVDGTIWSFSEDPANTDYQKYLKWVAEGNVAEEITNGN